MIVPVVGTVSSLLNQRVKACISSLLLVSVVLAVMCNGLLTSCPVYVVLTQPLLDVESVVTSIMGSCGGSGISSTT